MNAGLPPHMQSELSQQRNAYQQKMEAQLARCRADIYTLEAELNRAQPHVQVALRDKLTILKSELRQAQERLDNLKASTGDAWVELKTDFDDYWQNIPKNVSQVEKEVQRA